MGRILLNYYQILLRPVCRPFLSSVCYQSIYKIILPSNHPSFLPSIRVYVCCMSVYLSIHQPIKLFNHQPISHTIHPSIRLATHSLIQQLTHPTNLPSIHQNIHQNIPPSIDPSSHASFHPSTHPDSARYFCDMKCSI